jgi:hypothetical protein
MSKSDRADAERTYDHHLPRLRCMRDRFVLIHGTKMVGVFSTQAVAEEVAMGLSHPDLALIRKIGEGDVSRVAVKDATRVPVSHLLHA